jgi:hypothetical protein
VNALSARKDDLLSVV